MFTKYVYLAGITQADMMNDIVLLLTGTTDKALLSASCDQANTEILTTYAPAGWTLHDAAAGTNAKVIKAACDGDAAQFKYVKISTAVAGQIFTGLWHDWNATSHVGTNLSANSETSGYGQRYSTTLAGTVYISASERQITIWGTGPAGNGMSNYGGSMGGIWEGDRGFTWCDVGTSFTPVCFAAGSYVTMPRHMGPDGNLYTSGTAQGIIVILGKWLNSNNAITPSGGIGIPMSSGFGTYVSSLMVCQNGATTPTLSGFSNADLFAHWGSVGNTLDEVMYAGKQRIFLPVHDFGAGSKVLVPKG